MAELRRVKGAPAGDRRRVLTAFGRPPGIPAEWMVERHDDGTYSGHDTSETDDQAERVARREKKAEGRVEKLRIEIRAILRACGEPMTRKEIWEALPDAMRVNEVAFREVLEDDEQGWSLLAGKGTIPSRYVMPS